MDPRWQTLWQAGREMDKRFGLKPVEIALWLFRGLLLRWLEDQRVQGAQRKHRLLDYEAFQYPMIIPLLAREVENLNPVLSGLFPPQSDWSPLIFVIESIRGLDLSDLDPRRVQAFLMEGLAEFPWEYPLTDGVMAFLFDALQVDKHHRVHLPQAGTSPLLFSLWGRTRRLQAWESSPVGPLLRTLWFFLDRPDQTFVQEAPPRDKADFLFACGQADPSPLTAYKEYVKKGGRLVFVSRTKERSLQQWVARHGGQGVCLKDPGDPVSLFFWQKPVADERDGVWATFPLPDGEGEPYPASWQGLALRIEEVFLQEAPHPEEAFPSLARHPSPPEEPAKPAESPAKKPLIRSWIDTLPELSVEDWGWNPPAKLTEGETKNPVGGEGPPASAKDAEPSPPHAPEEAPPEEPAQAESASGPSKPLFTPLARQVHNLYRAAANQTLKKK